ncbi:hypothetical protein [Dyadobacter sp. BHUBP1]|uniref:hypothetical protein n=1 Tax=Dyadobacter sp. BHUBP1 TaxID=3424178 RepID=UPI003D343C9D
MVHSNSEFMHLCLSLLEKQRDEKLRKVLIDEAIGFATRPIEGRMSVDVYGRYLFCKVLAEVYYAGMKAGHAAIGVTAATGSQMTRKIESLSAAQKLALEVAPFIKALRETGYISLNEIANKLNELDRPAPNGIKWDAQLVERTESLIFEIKKERQGNLRVF